MANTIWDQVHSDKTRNAKSWKISEERQDDQMVRIPYADWDNYIVLDYEKIHIDFRLFSPFSI